MSSGLPQICECAAPTAFRSRPFTAFPRCLFFRSFADEAAIADASSFPGFTAEGDNWLLTQQTAKYVYGVVQVLPIAHR